MPGVEAAFLEGRLTADHVRVLATARRAAPEAFEDDEAELVDDARSRHFRQWDRRVRYWIQRNEPDEVERDAAAKHACRHLHASESLDGMTFVDGVLDPIGGAIFRRELTRLEQRLFEADWAEARDRLGEAATAADLGRTPAQRRADALRVMAERSAAKAPGAVEPRILLHVLAGTDAVHRMCELSDGTIVTPGQVVPLLRWADVERVIFDGPSKVIDVGVRRRLYSGATRTAVELRDLTCQHPGCDVPAERCEIDHILPFEEGGLTTQANGRCLCPFHHRWRHRRTPPAA